jgi:lambda family phage portal protein
MKKIAKTSPLKPSVNGGYDGASRTSRELAAWSPIIRSADQDINWDKPQIDARAIDMTRNEGYALGAVNIHKDSIVGGQYVLNALPDWETLGATEAWAEEFQKVVETKFGLWGESAQNWPDASRINTFTSLVRLAVGIHTVCGEVLATAEWITAPGRAFKTAVQMVDVARLSNPYDQADHDDMRRGVRKDSYGAPLSYFIRTTFPNQIYAGGNYAQNPFVWKEVPIRKPWGRLQVVHIYEQMRPDQSRGVSDMVAVLKEMRMTKTFRDITLQNAVLQATYAASIESDLPADMIWEQMGVGADDGQLNTYLNQLAAYAGGAKGLAIDGVKIPHLFPGTKMKLQPAGTPGGVGTGFEESLQRHIAAALGLSYEEFSRDYTKTNYSSARASMLNTWKSMQSKKKNVADRFANAIYDLWLEEFINSGECPMPAGKTASHFYEGLNKEAYTNCDWIGASRGQIDELKETQAAVLRIQNNLSTYEDEISRGGKDFRRVFAQRKRENKIMQEDDLVNVAATTAVPGQKPNGQQDLATANDGQASASHDGL